MRKSSILAASLLSFLVISSASAYVCTSDGDVCGPAPGACMAYCTGSHYEEPFCPTYCAAYKTSMWADQYYYYNNQTYPYTTYQTYPYNYPNNSNYYYNNYPSTNYENDLFDGQYYNNNSSPYYYNNNGYYYNNGSYNDPYYNSGGDPSQAGYHCVAYDNNQTDLHYIGQDFYNSYCDCRGRLNCSCGTYTSPNQNNWVTLPRCVQWKKW